MRRVFAAISLSALLAAGACAGTHKVMETTSATPPMPSEGADESASILDGRFAGTWYVSGAFPAAATDGSAADQHLGTSLVIGAEEVSDVNGQRCITPAFASGSVAASDVKLAGAEGALDQLTVTCDGKGFATFLRLPDRSGEGPALFQQRPEGLYLLEQAAALQHRLPSEAAGPIGANGEMAAARTLPAHEEPKAHEEPAAHESAPAAATSAPVELTPKPKESAETAAVPSAVPEGPVAEAHAASAPASASASAAAAAEGSALPAKGTAMHLASYKGMSAAKRGWKILLGEYDELDPLSPLYATVDVPGKGPMIRLYATGATPAEITRICAALRAKNAYCALNP